MKKSVIAIIVLVVLCGVFVVGKYNSMVSLDENVTKVWADVEAAYQRRADLIPNLVATVKGYAEHEKSTFEAVTEARAKVSSMNLNVEDLTEENLAKYIEAQSQLSGALSRLIAVSESYPELKASEQFSELQAQLEGTENRINEVRKKFNEAAQVYNVAVRKFPGNIIANFFGFERRAEFKAEAGAKKAPTVAF